MLLLEVGWNTLHDLLGLCLVVNGMSVQVAWSAELQLGDVILLSLLDCDLFCLREELLLSSHDLDELLQIFDFLWLHLQITVRLMTATGNAALQTSQLVEDDLSKFGAPKMKKLTICPC